MTSAVATTLTGQRLATAGSDPVLLGDQSVGATQDGGQGTSEAFGYTASVTGTATNISVYLDSTDGVRLGLYSDKSNEPGVRLDAGSVASNSAGWVTVPLSGGAQIASGTRYWIAIAASSSTATVGYRDTGWSGSNLDYSGQGLENPYSISQEWSSNPASVYVGGTTSTPPPPVAPANTALPAVSGTAQQGHALTTSTGTWTGTAPITYKYQWQENGTTTITNATGSIYTASAADVGATLDVVVTATNSGGSTTATSKATKLVAAPPPAAPSNTALGVVTGTDTPGQSLATTNGSWTGSPTSYTYQWQACNSAGAGCANVSGAKSSSYTLTGGDVGDTIHVVVTATNAGGSTSATSAATPVVTVTPPSPPSNTLLGVVSGTDTQGQMLSTTIGSWTGSPTSYTYQWRACDGLGANCFSSTPGGTSSSYMLTSGDVGDTMRVVVTATNAGGSTAATSAATLVVGSSGGGGTVVLPHDPSFVGPSYYTQFANGPSSSVSQFPICTYQVNLGQWSQLASRITGMGVNCIDDAYGSPAGSDYTLGAANGLTFNVQGSGQTNPAITSHAMQDEPNSQGSQYAASSCSPTNDTCGQKYVNDANAYRGADPNRPVWGNFSKDLMEWSYPPSGWSSTQFTQHNSQMLGALDIVSSDNYGWTDDWEWNQTAGQTGNDHFGAWIYGHAISRINGYNPSVPAYGFVECCDSGDGSGTSKPSNEMMPGMLQAAVWNILVHGGRGWTYWTTNFWDSSNGGDPYANPYSGATYQGSYALYGEHQWDPQYAAAQSVDQTVNADAVDLNSPTVSAISASSSSGVPVTALGKDVAGKLWLLAQADGNTTYPLSNQTTITATITLPSTVPAGTVLNVIGENRTVTVNANHQITDTFATTTETTFNGTSITYGYQHHIYAMP